MMRPRLAVLAVSRLVATLAVVAALGAVGCNDPSVGRICDLGTATPQVDEAVVASPSLDCVTRTCLRVPLGRALPPGSAYPSGNSGLCTAECATSDDCERVPESPCITGFTCGVPPGITVGPYCCRKFCICKDYIVVPESGNLDAPIECDAANAKNACCNLAGRRGNPSAYPACVGT
jgi:hypothetical protein